MGCKTSKLDRQVEKPGGNAIDRALQAALQQHKGTNHKRSLSELLLKFPSLKKGFLKCRELFRVLDVNHDNLIDWNEFVGKCSLVGLNENDPTLRQMFDAADIDHSQKLDVFEFINVLLFVYLLHPESANSIDASVRSTVDTLQQFFSCFDASSDGFLQKDEVQIAMGLDKDGKSSGPIAQKLFDSLDWDGNGSISFKEFVMGIERLVMEDEDEEDG